tara:strand:+ start:1433 stop:1696 length:264 start_codon:yes stop_codon:yes gene_type:complete
MPNPFRKGTDIDTPYATYVNPQGWEWRILKTYKQPSSEAKDPYARWFVAARSPLTDGRWEMGDTYKQEVIRYGRLTSATPEWKESYK